jgi:hypothetical protein
MLADNPATDRLKEEAQRYFQARAEQALSGLGQRLGESLKQLGDPASGGAGGLLGGLAKGGKTLAGGGSPTKALMKAGTSQMKDKIKGAFGGGGGDGGKSSGGGGKGMTIIEDLDVGVPVRVAYDQWTQFEEFSSFAKGVTDVDIEDDDVTSKWTAKIAQSTRTWKATVTDQVPDRRISWTSEGSRGTVNGVVTFHPLGENLTRVLLVLEYFPSGFVEKTGNLWRAQGRRARLDLKLFRKFVTMRGEATDAWRGEIRDGEVVKDHETAVQEEERGRDTGEDEEPGRDEERAEDEKDFEEEEDEPEEDEDAYGEEEEDEDFEEEPEKPRRRPARR